MKAGTADRYTCRTYYFSEKGPIRLKNEDNLLVLYPDGDRCTVFAIIADGMGGHKAGEVASSMACELAGKYIQKHFRDKNVPAMLKAMMQLLQKGIVAAGNKEESVNGMGTTATAIFIRESSAYYAHIGDSRLYLVRNQELLQCTEDDTLVEQMQQAGLISAQEASYHFLRNVLTQALGASTIIEPQISPEIPINHGDRFLLCSDGLYNVFDNEEFTRVLNMRYPKRLIDSMKSTCHQRYAEDNFSCILIQVTDSKTKR